MRSWHAEYQRRWAETQAEIDERWQRSNYPTEAARSNGAAVVNEPGNTTGALDVDRQIRSEVSHSSPAGTAVRGIFYGLLFSALFWAALVGGCVILLHTNEQEQINPRDYLFYSDTDDTTDGEGGTDE
jgi:hypothetical protein